VKIFEASTYVQFCPFRQLFNWMNAQYCRLYFAPLWMFRTKETAPAAYFTTRPTTVHFSTYTEFGIFFNSSRAYWMISATCAIRVFPIKESDKYLPGALEDAQNSQIPTWEWKIHVLRVRYRVSYFAVSISHINLWTSGIQIP
jgi:hypothetical protein